MSITKANHHSLRGKNCSGTFSGRWFCNMEYVDESQLLITFKTDQLLITCSRIVDLASFANKATTPTARKKMIHNQNKSEYSGIESLDALKIHQENPTKDENILKTCKKVQMKDTVLKGMPFCDWPGVTGLLVSYF